MHPDVFIHSSSMRCRWRVDEEISASTGPNKISLYRHPVAIAPDVMIAGPAQGRGAFGRRVPRSMTNGIARGEIAASHSRAIAQRGLGRNVTRLSALSFKAGSGPWGAKL
jgi:hypothetical protein